MQVSLPQWVKTHGVILVNTGSLIGTTAVTSLLGFMYWWLAAQQFQPEAIGFASAAISAMTLLGTFCMLGLGTLLIKELPQQQHNRGSLISTALLLVGVVGVCVGIVFAIVAPYISIDFQPLRASLQNILLFATGVSLTAITLVLDQAVIGLLRGGLQLWRNGLFAAIKLAALFIVALWLSQKAGLTIYATWAVGNLLSLVILAGFVMLKEKGSRRTYWPDWGLLRNLKLVALQHHIFNLVIQVPTMALPVLVTILLSATMNAWFYIALMLANFAFVIPYALTTVLYAASSTQPAMLAQKTKLTLSLALVASLVANCALLLGAKQLLGFFGYSYAEQALWSLRILALAAFPLIIKNHYIALSRIQGWIAKALLPVMIGTLLELGVAALGARLGGLTGLSLGWIIATGVEAIWMFRPVYKAIWPTDTSAEIPVQSYGETEPTWLVDTLVLASIKLDIPHDRKRHHQEPMVEYGYNKYSNGNRPHLGPVRLQPVTSWHDDSFMTAAIQHTNQVLHNEIVPIKEYRDTKENRDARITQMKYSQGAVSLDTGNILPTLPLSTPIKLPKRMDVVSVLLPLCAFILWFISVKGIDLQRMNDLGLISVLPLSIIVALVIMMISFCLALQRSQMRVPLLFLHLLLLVFMLYGITAIIEEVPGLSVVYRHAGYTEYIMRTGTVDPTLDTYFNWPGFFIFSAFLTRIAGYHNVFSFVAWAPVFFNLIYLAPLSMIFTSITTDKRLVWLGLWFFALTNWIEQDFFLPQAFNFFLYLVIIAILVKWFKIPPKAQIHEQRQRWQRLGPFSSPAQKLYEWLTAPDTFYTPIQPQQRTALLVVLVIIFALVVFSHPLTPFFVLASVTSLVICRRCGPFWLPILMAIMTATWILIMARPFLEGHSSMVTGDFLHLGNAIASNVTDRVAQGDAQHTFIAEMRVMMTAVIWGLACVGGVRRLRNGYRDATYVLLAVVPFPLLAVQQYGGEMLLRIYLFSLPLMVFFAAALFYTASTDRTPLRKSSWLTVAIVGISIVLLSGFLFTRYGNERMDYKTYAEVDGVRHLYNIAPRNALLLEGWDGGTPWIFRGYEKYNTDSLSNVLNDDFSKANDVNNIIHYIRQQNAPAAYIIFTRSQRAAADSAGLPSGTLDRLENALLASGTFKKLYSNPDAQILMFVGGVGGTL